jgi:hypothetical protein
MPCNGVLGDDLVARVACTVEPHCFNLIGSSIRIRYPRSPSSLGLCRAHPLDDLTYSSDYNNGGDDLVFSTITGL